MVVTYIIDHERHQQDIKNNNNSVLSKLTKYIKLGLLWEHEPQFGLKLSYVKTFIMVRATEEIPQCVCSIPDNSSQQILLQVMNELLIIFIQQIFLFTGNV